jgi:hypothetical protein
VSSPPSPEDGNRFNFRNVVFSILQNTGRWKKSKNPVILCVIHHRRNRLESSHFRNTRGNNKTTLSCCTVSTARKFLFCSWRPSSSAVKGEKESWGPVRRTHMNITQSKGGCVSKNPLLFHDYILREIVLNIFQRWRTALQHDAWCVCVCLPSTQQLLSTKFSRTCHRRSPGRNNNAIWRKKVKISL